MDLWSYLFIIVGVVSVWTPPVCSQHTSPTASFHGGYFNVSQHSSNSSLTLELLYKTSFNTGIIFMTSSTDSPSHYLAIACNHSHIQLLLNHGSGTIALDLMLDETTLTDWHRLSLSLHGILLEVSVGDNSLSRTLQSELNYSSVYLGGPESFLSPHLSDLPSQREFFIGCMTNVTINNYDVMFDSTHPGVQSGCCIAARPLLYCFEDSESNLIFRTPPSSILFSSSSVLTVSFQIATHHSGHVFSIDLNTTSLIAVLSGTTLTLQLTTSSQSLTCPQNISEGVWHSVTLTFDPTSLSCNVDGVRSSVSVQLSSLTLTLITFGRPNHIPEDMTTFGGCVRQLQLNEADLSPQLATSTNMEQVIGYDGVQWNEIQVQLNPLEVMEGESVRVSSDIIHITLPQQVYSDEYAGLYEREIQQAIQVVAVNGPNEGYFTRGDSMFRMSDFTYYDTISLSRDEQIIYRHGGSINMSDSASLEVFVDCDGRREEIFEGTLVIDVDKRNDIPVVSRRQRMDIAMGTSRIITSDIITVSDEETRDLEHIVYSVVGLFSPRCGTCEGEMIGRVIRTHSPHLGAVLFSQAAINSGNISFEHYPLFGTAEVTINLRVSDNNGGSINTSIEVLPYEGHITLLTEENMCIFVKEGGFAVLDSTNLNATSDFEDQHPILTYDVIQGARFGALEKWVTYPRGLEAQWITLEKKGILRNGVPPPHSFTQEDINNGRIRYVHHNSSQLFNNYDTFTYQLRSTNLPGPTGNFCINVVFNDFLLTPDISIEIQPITVNEGGNVTIDDQTLDTAVDVEAAYILDPIDTEQLGIVYFLVSPPSVGQLTLNNHFLKSGDNFTEGDVRARYLEYTHFGSEHHVDNFTVFAQAVITDDLLLKPPNVTSEVTAHVTITPVNNHPPRLSKELKSIRPAEGGWITVTTEHINVIDEDRPGDPLDIYLRNPRANKPNEKPNGHFAFASNPSESIRTFQMEHIKNREVIFVHNMSESASLNYTQRLRIGDTRHYVRPSITIKVKPLTLSANLHLPVSGCLARLDAINDHPTFILNHTHFSFMLTDHHGNNSNLIHDIKVNVSTPPSVGSLHKTGTNDIGASSQFTVADIRHDIIEYRLGEQRNANRDQFTLSFYYGHSEPVSILLTVCIEPLPFPNHVAIVGVSVPYEGVVGIGPTHLWANISRGSADSLEFHITRPPRYGVIINQRSDELVQLETFTQADLNANRVAYEHINFTDEHVDSFEFEVCNVYGCSETHSFPISIFFVNLTIVNTGFSCLENLTHLITLEEMNIFAPQGFKNEKFSVVLHPSNGNISVDNIPKAQVFSVSDIETSSVFYRHGGEENLHDSFEFNATAKSVDTGEVLYVLGLVNISIIPVNNHRPEITNRAESVTVAKGGSLTFSSEWLSAIDVDSNTRDEDIVYRVRDPWVGYYYLNDNPGTGIKNWTEEQLKSGRVSYRQDGKGTVDVLHFSLFDGQLSSSENYTTIIYIKDIIFTMCGTDDDTVMPRASVVEGATTVITSNELCVDASNDHSVENDDIIYNIKTLPGHGTLEFNSSLLEEGSEFTRAQLQSGNILYTHDHSNEERDSFKFDIKVRRGESTTKPESFTFDFDILPVDDDPPHVTVLQDPAFVVELGALRLDNTVLEIVDRDSRKAKEVDLVVCNVITPPRYGLLPRTRFGAYSQNSLLFTKYDIDNGTYQYNHTSLGHTKDSFTFNITDGVNHQNDTYTVNIVILPIEILLSVYTIAVQENGYVSLREEFFLQVEHDYLQTINGHVLIQPGDEPVYGVFRRNTSDCSSIGEAITEFTTDEMAAGSIIYCHGGSEHSNDSFKFVYASIGPPGNDRMSNVYSVRIEVTPHNDQPPVLWKHRGLSIEPWTRDNVLLGTRYLNATDGDTPDDGLFYTFEVHNDGFIAFVDAPLTHIQTFTQQDVNEERVLYAHRFDREGSISYTVSDGTFSAHGNITISARDLLLLCEREKWKQLEVDFKGSVELNTSYLECTTNDDEAIRPIWYTVENLQHGFFQVDGVERSKFNSSELNSGVVSYIHSDVDYWEPEESLTVTVSTRLADDVRLILNIRINYPNSSVSPLAVNKGVELAEGEGACLSEDVLDARNLRYLTFKRLGESVSLRSLGITFRITSLPAHGELRYEDHVMRGTHTFTQDDVIGGVVCYYHDDSENYSDTIPFTLVIGNQSLLVVHQSINISVIPVNDEQPYLVTSQLNVTLVDGFDKQLTQHILEVRDDDTSPANIHYRLVSLPSNAQLFKEGQRLSINDEFTQDNINRGLLKLRPLSLGNSSFQFTVRDEDTTLNYEFSVTVEKHMLTVNGLGVIEFKQNQYTAPITTHQLDTFTNGEREDTRFVITTYPTDGNINVDQTIVSEFKQVDVDKGRVSYVPDTSSEQHKDQFTVEVRNRDEIFPGIVLRTTVLVLGDVKETTGLDFGSYNTTSDNSLPLPADVLSLNQLQFETGSLPRLEVIDGPMYGRLVKKYTILNTQDRTTRQADNDEIFTFKYNELKNGWIFYTWDSISDTNSPTVTDYITVLVYASGMKPGQAIINLQITPPIGVTPPPALTVSHDSTTDLLDTPSSRTGTGDDGFPMYVLIPIVGIILILILVIIVVVLFCLTQQNKIKKKLQPNVGSSTHNHTHYPIPLTTAPRPIFSPRYDFDPTGPTVMDSDNEDENSETSSGFSESISARQSPAHSPHIYTHVSSHSHLSPAYSNQPIRPRIRSNVSITYSSRNSVTSDLSVDDSPEFYSHSLPRPHFQLSMPIPVRPASHAAFRDEHHRGLQNTESGYASVTIRDNSPDDVAMVTTTPADNEDNDTSTLKVGVSNSDHMTFPNALEDDDSSTLPEFANPSLFRVTNFGPVLKKEEYWV